MRKEIRLTHDEFKELRRGQKVQREQYLTEHIRKCALKKNAEYIKHQFNDKPAPLSERMPWGKSPKVATKEDLIENETV